MRPEPVTGRLVDSFLELVRIDSESGAEAEIAGRLRTMLERIGLEVEQDHAASIAGCGAGNLYARLPGDPSREPLMLCAHMDTVTPGRGVRPVIENGVIRSAGDTILGADDKAGIAAILEVVRLLVEHPPTPHGDVTVLFTVAEETGLHGARQVDPARIGCRYGLVLDTTGTGHVVRAAPEHVKFDIVIRGRAAHAGIAPEEGISAIKLAGRFLTAVPIGRVDPETTQNIGVIAGGERTNIITPEVRLKGEVRSHRPGVIGRQLDDLRRLLEDVVGPHRPGGAAWEMEVRPEYEAYALDPQQGLLATVIRAARAIGHPLETAVSGGGSDANVFNRLGMECVVIGAGMQAVHTTAEHVAVADLEATVRLVLAVVAELASVPRA